MCGICGFFDTSHSTGAAQLEAMTMQLQHRGPDGSGTQLFNSPQGSLGLGHRRLSIIELSPLGKQPMAFEHLWVSFNGEIYNHAELRLELEQLGHRFISHSDTEVLLQAYARWGEAAISRFTGMFAFALYNSQTHNLLLCRDRAGVKPLFYYYHNGFKVFGIIKAGKYRPAVVLLHQCCGIAHTAVANTGYAQGHNFALLGGAA